MRVLIIRHGDPDYEHDTLTEKGWREAELLSEKTADMNIKNFYISPFGRAQDTASCTLKKCGRKGETLPWLKEFSVRIDERPVIWDMLPEVWTAEEKYYDKDSWADVDIMEAADVKAEIKKVTDGLDALLERHGYKREGKLYRAVTPNEDTIALFCHFGVQGIMLGHLLGISPMVLWHGAIALPTAVTTLVTEERREGKAVFRINSFGDTSHLTSKGEEPSFAGRFCEMYTNSDQRHD